MSSYQDRKGVWVTYARDHVPYAIRLYDDVVPAARDCARAGHGAVAFWPFNVGFLEAIEEWEKEPVEQSASGVLLKNAFNRVCCHLQPYPANEHALQCMEHPNGWRHIQSEHQTCEVCKP